MFANIFPKLIREIDFGWKNRWTENGYVVVEHTGEIRMPDLISSYNWRKFEIEMPPKEWDCIFNEKNPIVFGTRNFKSVFTTGARFLGYTQLLVETPDLTPITDGYVEWNERLLKTFNAAKGHEKIKYFMIGDDYAHNHGLFIHPDWWKEWVYPHLKRLVELGQKYGCEIIFHSDGDMREILDDIVDLGVSVINFEPVGRMKSLLSPKNEVGGQYWYRNTLLWVNTPEMQ